MITKIGIVAGEIWEYLDKKDKSSSLEDIVKGIDRERDSVLMSIGWLAREGHIVIEGEASEGIVRLVK